MFVDSAQIILSSGNGGKGAVSFRREKHVNLGGPDGGDGGRGGDVYIKVDNNTHTLSHFKGKNHLKAQNGINGKGRNMFGKKGEDLEVIVPPGTQILDLETNEILLDLPNANERVKFLQGGIGGLGNSHFKSSTNQRPDYAQPGRSGESKKIKLELKLIADVGLVGFPNVGKSTLISVLSNAKPEIANYEFTTLTPKLGLVDVDDFHSFVMADIPGIIDGASDGRGLGLEFLKHIERTSSLLFCIDLVNYRSLEEQFFALKNELKNFSKELLARPYGIVLTKFDAIDDEFSLKFDEFLQNLELKKQNESQYLKENEYFYAQDIEKFDIAKPYFILPISSATNENTRILKFILNDLVRKTCKE